MDVPQTPHEKLSVEMILRRSLRDSFNDYRNNCSLTCVKFMCASSGNWMQRLMWMLVFASAFSTVLYFLHYTWYGTLNKPLIVTLESTEYPIENIDFPAIAICNVNRISKKALKKFAKEEYEGLGHKKDVEKELVNFGRLIDYSYNESLKHNIVYMRMVEKYRLEADRIVSIMKSLAPACNQMLVRCAWAGNFVDCASIFNLRRTANRGHCCIFNYLVNFNSDNSWFKIDHRDLLRQITPGLLHGLSIILDPQLEDYAYSLRDVHGFDVLLFDPMHYADPTAGRVIHRIAEPNTATFIEIKSTKQIATAEVKKYNVNTRKCLFADELRHIYFGHYSYSSCLVRCKMVTIQSLCRCIPYFVALNNKFLSTPVCTFEHLRCLEKYKEKLFYLYPYGAEGYAGLETEFENSLTCPECLPDCELTKHTAKTYSSPLVFNGGKAALDNYFGGINMTDKCSLHIFNPTHDAILVRLDVVYYWYEILSNFGGFCGVIIGSSITSIVEIIYFLTVRYWQHFYNNYKKFH